jgi:16S rRNA (guanine(527)-N(7))-methyltransferase RsmG
MTDTERLQSIGEWLGTPWTIEQETRFLAFAEFLKGEGVASGAVGPHEVTRMMDRHICDSLVFVTAIDTEAESIVDVGSGVGLPGIPVAIARPDVHVTLLDRSQRRTDLASRAVRILGLENVTVETGDVSGVRGSWDVALFRASLGIDDAAAAFQGLTIATGVGVFGVSRLPDDPEVPSPPPGVGYDLSAEATEVLDSPSWLLRMRHV